MAKFEYQINGGMGYMNVYLPIKIEDKKTHAKLINDVKKIIVYCNLKNNANNALEILEGEPQYICEYCKKTFKKVNALSSHIKVCKQLFDNKALGILEGQPQYTCEYCEKIFKKANGMASHLKACKPLFNNNT